METIKQKTAHGLTVGDRVSLPNGWDEHDNEREPLIGTVCGFYGPNDWPQVELPDGTQTVSPGCCTRLPAVGDTISWKRIDGMWTCGEIEGIALDELGKVMLWTRATNGLVIVPLSIVG